MSPTPMSSSKNQSLGIAFLLAAAASGCKGGPSVETVTAEDRGAELFEDASLSASPNNPRSCADCHSDGSTSVERIFPGGSLAGATARPSYWGGQEIDLLRAVNDCRRYFLAQPEPWTADDADAEDLYAYLEALSEGAPGDPVKFTIVTTIEDLPPGDAERGQGTFERACSHCHGQAHAEGARPDGAPPALPEHALDAYPPADRSAEEVRLLYVEQVRRGAFGGHGGEMPPFSAEALSDGDLADVLAFLGLY